MNWLEICGYLINLDNVCFFAEDKEAPETKTQIGYIGGASLILDIPKNEVAELVKEHHKNIGAI